MTLPGGWASATAGDVIAGIDAGKSLSGLGRPAGPGEIGVLKVSAMTWGEFRPEENKALPPGTKVDPKWTVRAGDLLFSRANTSAYVGACVIVPRDHPNLILSDKSLRLGLAEGIDPSWMVYALRSESARRQIESLATGTKESMRNISQEKMRTIQLPLPPSDEQARIVAAIEEAFSLLDAGETSLHATRTRLRRMRESVLTSAVTGQLVPQDSSEVHASEQLATLGVAAKASPTALPPGWVQTTVGDLATVGTGMTPLRSNSSYWDGGDIPWVTSGLLNQSRVSEAQEFVTERALRETSLRVWPAGTLLVAMYGEGRTRGRCAELLIEATCNQACAAVQLRDPTPALTAYLHLLFEATYRENRRLASGGVQTNLNLGLVRDICVPLPPTAELVRIVAEVERQFSFIEAAERAVADNLKRSTALRRSVLQAAFEGRMVPQDPSDEPASVLLERIRAERAAAGNSGARRRRGKVGG